MSLLVIILIATTLLVLAIAYFVFRLARPSRPPFRSPAYWISGILITPLTLLGVGTLWYFSSITFDRLEFDKHEWEIDPGNRYVYVDDLIENRVMNMSREAITELLGETENTSDSTMVWYIGYYPGEIMNSLPSYLVVSFENGTVRDARIDKDPY